MSNKTYTFILCMTLLQVAFAAHFRYGFLSWSVDSTNIACGFCSGTCIQFTQTAAWAINRAEGFTYNMGDGTTTSSVAGVLIESGLDALGKAYEAYRYQFAKCYDTSATKRFVVYGTGCCRISDITNQNYVAGTNSFEITTTIDLNNPTNTASPLVSSSTVIGVPVGTSTYRLAASDPDGTVITCSLLLGGTSNPDWYFLNNKGITIDPSTCTLQLTNLLDGERYVITVRVQDQQGSEVLLDVQLISSGNIRPSIPPSCTGQGAIPMTRRDTVSYTFQAFDADVGDQLSITHQGPYPNGISMTPATGTTVNGQPATNIVVTFTPPPNWRGLNSAGTIFLRDTGGQVALCSYNFVFEPIDPIQVTLTAPVGQCGYNILCNGGQTTISSTITGGAGPFQYSWDNTPNSAATTYIATAGVHTLQVTDSYGNQGSNSINLRQPDPLLFSCSVNPPCSATGCVTTSTITCSFTGGCGPFTLSAQGQNYIANASPYSFTAPSTGDYNVAIQDANGCQANSGVSVPTYSPVQMTTEIQRNGLQQDVRCVGEYTYIFVTPSGGCGSYSITFNTASPGTRNNVAAGSREQFAVQAGSYTITVTEKNGSGCSTTSTITVTQPPETFDTDYRIVSDNVCGDVVCHNDQNGAIDVDVTRPATIVWTPGSVTGFSPRGLDDGTYSYTVTDANGCSITKADVFIVDPTSDLVLYINNNPNSYACGSVQCFGDKGALTISPTGGCGTNYHIRYDNTNNPTTIPDDTLSVSGLNMGTYRMTVRDENGCVQPYSTTLTEPNPLTNSFVATNPRCFGTSTGSIVVTVNGGCQGHAIQWTPNTYNGYTLNGLPAGTYSYVVTDVNGCTTSNSVTLGQPTQLVASIAYNCGVLSTSPSGGTPPYSIQWAVNGTSFSTAATVDPPIGLITLVVRDSMGCQVNDQYILRFPVIDTGLTDFTTWTTRSGTWSKSVGSAIQNQAGNGLFILESAIDYTSVPAITGKFTTPSVNNNNVIGLIAGYSASNTYYFMIEWRGMDAGAPCGITGALSGLNLLRVPTGASECDIAARTNGVVVLQAAGRQAPWDSAQTHSFFLSMTSEYIMFDLNGVLELSYWFQSTEPALQPGHYAAFSASQLGLNLISVATDAKQKSCPQDGMMTIQKRFTSDTTCSDISFTIDWGDGTAVDTIAPKLYSLNSNHQGMTDVFSHTYTEAGKYEGLFCMYADGYTHCDPFHMLLSEWYFAATNFLQNMRWIMYQPQEITWKLPNVRPPVRTVKMELWNQSFTRKHLDAGSNNSGEKLLHFKGVSNVNPSDYKLALYWQQGEKKCHFRNSPLDIQVRIAGNTQIKVPPT